LASHEYFYQIPNFNPNDYRPSEYLIVNPDNIEPAGFFSTKDVS
jgi:hypothetical protein